MSHNTRQNILRFDSLTLRLLPFLLSGLPWTNVQLTPKLCFFDAGTGARILMGRSIPMTRPITRKRSHATAK